MKKFFALALAMVMALSCLSACSKTGSDNGNNNSGDSSDTIKIGMLGPYTGDTAVYGLAVKNGAMLYIDSVNAAGGINGKTLQVLSYDNKADDAEAVNAFTRLVDEGIVGLVGDVLTSNTIAVVGEAYPINMPMVTASATAAAVTYDADSNTVYPNVFRACFIDPFQGEKMAEYAKQVLNVSSAAVIYETGSDYSSGLSEAFVAKCKELGITVVDQEGYATGDVDFKAQLANIAKANPDVIFCPNYYQDNGMIVTQARAAGITAPFLGGDGWGGVKDYASAADLEGSVYCSAYAPASTDEIKNFESSYKTTYGEDVPNMFAALGYDAAMLLVNGIKAAEDAGLTAGSDEYKQAVIDGIRNNSSSLVGITSATGYTFDEYNNPIKEAVIMKLEGGKEVFSQMF